MTGARVGHASAASLRQTRDDVGGKQSTGYLSEKAPGTAGVAADVVAHVLPAVEKSRTSSFLAHELSVCAPRRATALSSSSRANRGHVGFEADSAASLA